MTQPRCGCQPPCEPPEGCEDYNGLNGQGYQPVWCSKPVMNPPQGDHLLKRVQEHHGFPPNFQLTHHHSGEVICFTRLFTEKQLRKLIGIPKDEWSRFSGRGGVPPCDTYVNGEKLWTDTTLKDILTQYPPKEL